MSDVIELLERANPVAVDRLGALDEAAARELLFGVTARPTRRQLLLARRPIRVSIVVAVVLLAAVPFASAFGLDDWLLHVSDSSVPPNIQRLFSDAQQPAVSGKHGPPSRGLQVVKSSERLVAQLHTQSGATASLYVADVKGGGWCLTADGGPFNGGGCSRTPFAKSPSTIIQGGVGMSRPMLRNHRLAAGVTTLGRTRSSAVASIRVDYRDGTTGTIAIAPGGWFLYEVPNAHLVRGTEPYRFVALSASGSVLETVTDPLLLERAPNVPRRPVPSTMRELSRQPLGWNGAEIVLSEARDPQGDRCIKVRNTGVAVTNRWSCGGVGERVRIGPSARKHGALVEIGGGRRVWPGKPGYVYLSGWAAPPVASLELRYQDSQTQQIPLHDRLYALVIPKTHWLPGHRPSYIIGRNAAGTPVFTRFLYPLGPCSYPGPGNGCPPDQITNSG